MTMPTKMCRACLVHKEISEFYACRRAMDGLGGDCKTCRRAYYMRKRQEFMAREVIVVPATKRCCRCKETKPSDQFWTCRSAPSGLAARCKPCQKLANRESYLGRRA